MTTRNGNFLVIVACSDPRQLDEWVQGLLRYRYMSVMATTDLEELADFARQKYGQVDSVLLGDFVDDSGDVIVAKILLREEGYEGVIHSTSDPSSKKPLKLRGNHPFPDEDPLIAYMLDLLSAGLK